MLEKYSLIRLFNTSSVHLINHIESLSPEDKYLRFGFNPGSSAVEKYVNISMATSNDRTHADFWFAIKEGIEIVATLHVAIRGDYAEFAFTTLSTHRGQGLGQVLFSRGYQLVTEYSISKIYMAVLTKNAPMRHIAKKFGLAVMVEGPDADASVTIQYPVSLKAVESVKQTLVDKGLFL